MEKRITYSERRVINIGDYESIKCELSYSTSIEKINEKENTLEILASETVDIDEEREAFEETARVAQTRVRKILNLREADIRARSARYTEHDTETKGLLFKLISLKNWRKKQNKVKVDLDEIDALDSGKLYLDDEE